MRSLVLMLSLLCSCALSLDTPPVPVVEPQRVFKVVARRDWKEQWTATAFFVSETRLLTAAHTFKKSNNQWIAMDGKEVHCRIVKIDFDQDIAILESEKRCSGWYRLASIVKVLGFPGGRPLEEHTGAVDSKRIHAKVYFVPGMSGGPLVNDYGDVEGMGVQGDIGGGETNCRFISASALSEFLKTSK